MTGITPIDQLLELTFKKPLYTKDVKFRKTPTKIEAQIFGLMLWWAQKSTSDINGTYHIKKDLIKKWVGWKKSKNSGDIFDSFEEIMSNPLKIESIEDNTIGAKRKKRGFINIFQHVFEEERNGVEYYTFKVHQDYEKTIKDPKVFILLDIVVLAILSANAKNKHAFQLYTYLRWKDYINEEIAPVDEIKSSLHIEKDSYQEYKIFNRDVLKPAFSDISKFSDIYIGKKLRTIREGRKIKAIVLDSRPQNMNIPLFIENEFIKEIEIELGLLTKQQEKMIDCKLRLSENKIKTQDVGYIKNVHAETGCAKAIIEKYLIKSGKDYIEERLKGFKADKKRGKEITTTDGAYFHGLLKIKDYKSGSEKLEQQEKELADKKKDMELIKTYKNLVSEYKYDRDSESLKQFAKDKNINLETLENKIETIYKNTGRKDYKEWRKYV